MILFKCFLFLLATSMSTRAQISHVLTDHSYRNAIAEKGVYHSKSVNVDTNVERDDDYRLPTSLSPISYFIRLQPFVNGDLTVRGYEEIIFEVLESTSNITLQTLDLTIYEDSFLLQSNDADLLTIGFISHTYDEELAFYIGTLEEPLEQGREYKLTLSFDGLLSSQGIIGFYQSTYVNEEGNVVSLATTQMQPNFARSIFPCFDEPSFKATFQVEIGREDTMATISNMPLLSTREITGLDGWSWDLFDVSPVMSAYLNAFVVSDFVSISATSDTGVEFRVWTHTAQIDQGGYGLDAGHRISTFFENYFDIPYPLPKQDMIAIPDYFFGAMENWGLIIYRESGLLLDPVLSSHESIRSVLVLIGHEVAHMWVGNLVTCEWWSDTWLNEGFAAYYQYLGSNEVEPDFDLMQYFVSNELQYIFVQDSLESSLPIRRDVPSSSQIIDLFGSITYSKGSVLVRMMENFLSHDTFLQGMKNYLNDNSYSNAVQEILFTHLNDQAQLDGTLDSNMSVQVIMETWTLQPGYPLITVEMIDEESAILTQERYLQTPNEDAVPYRYWVPITYTSQDSPNFIDTYPSVWMDPDNVGTTIAGLSPNATWHIFNIQQSSYYRVNYDAANWGGIADQLDSDYSVIDIRNRAQLIDDSFNLAQSGRISFDIPFAIAAYLYNEDHFVPWSVALRSLSYIESMFSRTANYIGLRAYLRSVLYPPYDTIGPEEDPLDAGRTIFLRSQLTPWVCHFQHVTCVDSAIAQYDEWMANPDDYSIISPNLKSPVYCVTVHEGNSDHWNFALNRYHSTDSSEEVDYLLFAMACSQDEPTLTNYLTMAFSGNGDIEDDDAYAVFANVASTDAGRDVAWDFLVLNYIEIAAFYESFDTVQRMAAEASRQFNTEKDLFELESFKSQLQETYFGSTDIIDAAIDSVNDNIAWMQSNYDDISLWLSNNGYGLV